MHKVFVTVTNSKNGIAKLTSYDYRPDRIRYEVPLYIVKVKGTDKDGNIIETKFKAIRFGVKRTKTINAHMVGLQDAQSYTLKWDNITTMPGKAWRVYAGFFVHKGPDRPLDEGYGSVGCIEICGYGEWTKFNNLILELADCNTLDEVSNGRFVKITYMYAQKPALKKL
ncbi:MULTISPECIES: hypothetical protein [unclassified Lacinutrix]